MTVQRHDAAPMPESDEQHVREVIDSAMSGSRPSVDLTAGALHRGRRLRTRRRLGAAAGAVAASVLAAAAAPWWLGAGAGAGGQVATDGTVASPAPAPTELPVEAPEGYWDMPSVEMVRTLEAILPDGVEVTDSGSLVADTEEGGPAKGFINSTLGTEVDGELVHGNINVMMWPDVQTWTAALDEPLPDRDEPTVVTEEERAEVDRLGCDAPLGHFARCHEIRDRDGTLVGRRSVLESAGLRTLEVTLSRDGGMVYAAVVNTVDDKWGTDSPLTAPAPLLTMEQLVALAENDAWVSHRP